MSLAPRAAMAGAAVCAFALAGCVTATSQTRQPLSADLAESGFVQEVYVSAAPDSGISAEFTQTMAHKLESKLADCAAGDHPLRVDVMLERVKQSNPLKSVLLTDTNEVNGQVTIYALETGEPVGSYSIAWKNRGGLGLGGALMQTAMGGGQVSAGFGEEICRRAFEGDTNETVQQVELF